MERKRVLIRVAIVVWITLPVVAVILTALLPLQIAYGRSAAATMLCGLIGAGGWLYVLLELYSRA